MNPLALRWRLTIPVALVLAVALAVVCAVAYHSFQELVISRADRSLMSAGEAIRSTVDNPLLAADRPAQIRRLLDALGEHAFEGVRPTLMARVWADGDGTNAIAIGPGRDLERLAARIGELPAPPPGEHVHFDLQGRRENWRAIWMRVSFAEGPGYVAVAESTGTLYGELHEVLWDFVFISLGVVAVVTMLSGALIVMGLRPIRDTALRLGTITAGNLGRTPWPAGPVPAELRPFVGSLSQMLERLNAALRQQKSFVADASHELRTPIAVAKSTLQLALETGGSTEEYRGALQDATEDLRRLEHLVVELLTLARLDEAAALSAGDVDLARLLGDLAESFQGRVAQAGGRLVCELDEACVRGDAGELHRLFSNLLDNALRHGPAGGEIGLRLRVVDGGVEVRVRDAGGRIAPEHLPHLFDRFYRADVSRSQATGGFGLGLAIAKAISTRHGGGIRIESSPAAGTCVFVWLPGPGGGSVPASPHEG